MKYEEEEILLPELENPGERQKQAMKFSLFSLHRIEIGIEIFHDICCVLSACF